MKTPKKQLTKLLIIDVLQSLEINFDEGIEILKETIEEMKDILKDKIKNY